MLAATTTSGRARRHTVRNAFSMTAARNVGWSGVSTWWMRVPHGRCAASSRGRNRLDRSFVETSTCCRYSGRTTRLSTVDARIVTSWPRSVSRRASWR